MERAPEALVVDASVVVKWFVPEEDSEKAVRLRDRHIEGSLTLIAPDLVIYEVINALTHHPEVSDEDLHRDVEALFMVDLDLVPPSTDLMISISERARKLSISIYDSSYLTLAELLATNLVTADKRLHEKAEDKRLVLMLGDLNHNWTL